MAWLWVSQFFFTELLLLFPFKGIFVFWSVKDDSATSMVD
jgi:hypothetical protein